MMHLYKVQLMINQSKQDQHICLNKNGAWRSAVNTAHNKQHRETDTASMSS